MKTWAERLSAAQPVETQTLRNLTSPSNKSDASANHNFYIFESDLDPVGPVLEAMVDVEFASVMMLAGYATAAKTCDGHIASQTLLSFYAIDGRHPELFSVAETDPGASHARKLNFLVQTDQPPAVMEQRMIGDKLLEHIEVPSVIQPYLIGWENRQHPL